MKRGILRIAARERIFERVSAPLRNPMAQKLIIAEKPSVANNIARGRIHEHAPER
ncbi:MAG: hypothetical protein NT123_04910 [Proteobacteria bacterium]|nr:hypothetical protein [Pseudomonadota bacterium]